MTLVGAGGAAGAVLAAAADRPVTDLMLQLRQGPPAARRAAAEAVARRSDSLAVLPADAVRRVVANLTSAVRDDDAEVRRWAALCLGRLARDPTRSVAALTGALTDPDHTVRDAAAFSLQFFVPAALASVGALLAVLRDPDPGVRESARMALLALAPPDRHELAHSLTSLTDNVAEVERLAAQAFPGPR